VGELGTEPVDGRERVGGSTRSALARGDRLSGPEIVKLTAGYAIDWGVDLPHQAYPFTKPVGNKRTALQQNLMAFTEPQRYRAIREICDYPLLRERNGPAVEKLKQTLIARYGHLAGEELFSNSHSGPKNPGRSPVRTVNRELGYARTASDFPRFTVRQKPTFAVAFAIALG
jgi:hypothetical protein